MDNLKKTFALLPAVVLCLNLTACGIIGGLAEPNVSGADWRTTGIARDGGTITRDGEDTSVLVCVHKADATFYYDTEYQTMFGSVDYPITLEGDAWEMFQGIDFADLNGDGNSDVTMRFDDGGSEILMVWFWDTESDQFVYQIPVLMGGALPFTHMEPLESENYEDGTYYYSDITEDGQIIVVNTVLKRDFEDEDDFQTTEDYLIDCALALGKSDNYLLESVAENEAYTEKMSYPVYIVTYTTGSNEDTREWTVFAMDTDRYTYLYGFCAMLDEADDMKSIYQDIFAGLYLSDGE